MAKMKEFFQLLWINLTVQLFSLVEFIKVAFLYYSNIMFLKIDLSILLTYFFDNPFTISKRFLMKRGEKDVYAYGETPLTTLDHIAAECQISAKDKVYELGCGRGRTCFWLNCFKKCNVVGIEFVPEFVERANRVKNKLHVEGVEFREQDMLETDVSDATVIYLYGTCYEDDFIQKIVEKFSKMPSGTKIITVSYPLTDYTVKPIFEVMKRFQAKFTWGETDVYLQIRT